MSKRRLHPIFGKLCTTLGSCTPLREVHESCVQLTEAVHNIRRSDAVYRLQKLCTAGRINVQLEEYIAGVWTQILGLKAALGGILQGVRINVPLFDPRR